MGLVREPLDVDFYVDPRPITKEDEKAISDYIKADKLKRARKTAKINSKNDLESHLLNGPVATKKQLDTIAKNRKAINQWRSPTP